MIKIRVYRQNNHIQEIFVEGHSDYAEYGSDIVCSGVSALTIGFINGLLEVCGLEDLEVEDSSGFVSVKVPSSIVGEDRRMADMFLESLVNGYEDIRENYPKELEVIQKEINHD